MSFHSFMAHKFVSILSILLVFQLTHVQSTNHGFISLDISQKGLNFAKDLLINTATSSLIPLELPQIEKTVKIPIIGKVYILLSNITIDHVDVPLNSSVVQSGEAGVAIVASGATANLSMDWRYSYRTWLFPAGISDQGSASVQVEGMEIGLSFGIENQQGTLKLPLQECGCYVESIDIKLNGGVASWLYQGLVDAFDGAIISAVESTITDKIMDEMMKIDSVLQSGPKEIPVDDVAALNITIMSDPVLSNSSVGLAIDGLFIRKDEELPTGHYTRKLQTSDSCKSLQKMVEISLHENVLNSATSVYFNANLMHWIIDKVPDQLLLNTSGWKYVIPKLYLLYPNDSMNLNITVTSPPTIKFKNQNIVATVYTDVTVNVLDAGEVIPVACISVVISASGFAKISRSTLNGGVSLSKFTVSLKWSKIGTLNTFLIQSTMSAVLKRVIIPVVNLRLKIGFPLPSFHGYRLEHAEVDFTDSRILICSDVGHL